MKIARLMVAVFSVSLRRGLAFRANLISEAIVSVSGAVASLAVLFVIYQNTGSLGGWSQGEAIALFGTYQIATGILWTFIEPNLGWFRNQVADGQLDDILLKPVPSIFLASLGTCAPLGLTQVGTGAVVLGIGVMEVGAVPSVINVLAWMLLFGAGIGFAWASRVALACLAFWAPSLQLDVLFRALWEFGRYPVSIYRQPIRFALSYVLPIAAIATIPTRALVERVSLGTLVGGSLVAVIAVCMVLRFWQAGLRQYTSATS
jgi:ABC-2 type transport system permease protein